MTNFDCLCEFTDAGMELFKQAFDGRIDENSIDLSDRSLVAAIPETESFKVNDWNTAKEMAEAIIQSAGTESVDSLLTRKGLWAWLAFVLRAQLFPRRRDSKRKLGEIHRWYPSDLNDYQKGQRHLVRMPVLLLYSFSDTADHLLCGKPSVPGEVREQLTSQQDMFHSTFQAVARALYYDPEEGTLRRGTAGKLGGSARRLAQVRKQLDVTWDLLALSPEQLLEKLPEEFNRFREQSNVEDTNLVISGDRNVSHASSLVH